MPSLRDRIRAFANPQGQAVAPILSTPEPKRATDAPSPYAMRPLRGGRQTQPQNFNPFGLTGWAFLPHRQYQGIDITELDVEAFSVDQLFQLLPDMSPEWGKAVWNYLRIAGTDISFQALTLNGEEDPTGQSILDDLILGVNQQWGGLDSVIRQLHLTTYLQGAASVDVAPTDNLRDLDDIYVINPESIYFERDRHQVLVPFQQQYIWGGGGGGAMPYRMMNEETFVYVPVDPHPDDPYGRSPVAPALQVVFPMAQVLRDLAKVVHHQGWPKIDMSLIWELMAPTIPEAVKQDEQRLQNWLDARLNEVVSAYNNIAPEDAFVHMDWLRVDSNAASAGTKLFDVASVIQVFRNELIEALKSLPIFHGGGAAQGDTETYGSLEWEIYVQSVEMMREIVAIALVRAFTVALQFRGHAGLIRHEWAPIATTTPLDDAHAEAALIENEVSKRDQGWTTQDDASNVITGSDAVAPPPTPGAMPMAPPAATPYALIPNLDDEELGDESDYEGDDTARVMPSLQAAGATTPTKNGRHQ